MKYGIIWWWNTLCYKNNRRRLIKANVDSSFKNSCPKSCLDHWSWILRPLKIQERVRTILLYQKGTILTKTRGWLVWDWNWGHSSYLSATTSLLGKEKWQYWPMWLWTLADIRSPAGNTGSLPNTGGFLWHSEQTVLTQCYHFLSAEAQTKSLLIQGYKWRRDLRIREEVG